MAQRPQRPKPTPKNPTSKVPDQNSTPGAGSNSPDRSGDANQQQTRRTRAATTAATQKQRQAIGFVSGGTTAGDFGQTKDLNEPSKTRRSQARNSPLNRATSKGKKKASTPCPEDNIENTNVHTTPMPPPPASTTGQTHQPTPIPSPHQPIKAIQRVQTRDQLDKGTDSLNRAPYRFEGSEPPPAPPDSQWTLVSSRPIQPAPQSLSLAAVSRALPDLQLPDPNNLYDQLRFYQGAAQHLLQSATSQNNAGPSSQHEPPPKPHPPAPRPIPKRTKGTRKVASSAKQLSTHGCHQYVHPSTKLSMIPEPESKDKRPLYIAMGLGGRRKNYIRIRARVRQIMLNAGIDWTKTWPKVPPNDKAVLYQMVRHQVPYMERFEMDWATARIVSSYAGHLRSEARKNNELPADPHYDYLKTNSTKRRKDAPRGSRLGLAKSQANATNNEGQEPGLSGAGPSSLPNVNTNSDEEMMDSPGLFGFNDPSDDENESGVDDNPDLERQE